MGYDYDDMGDTSRPRVSGSRWHFGAENELRFWKTIAGPDATAYPPQEDGCSVYYVEWQKNPGYTEIPGVQPLTSTDTGKFGYIFNLEPAKYIEEGAKGIAWKYGKQWYTIDKVTSRFVTHRKYDLAGNQLWKADHGVRVDGIYSNPTTGKVYVCSTGPSTLDGAHLRRYSSTGVLELSITYTNGFFNVTADASGNIYALSFLGELRKYDSDGNLLWTRSTVGLEAIALDGTNGVYVCGASQLEHVTAAGGVGTAVTAQGRRITCTPGSFVQTSGADGRRWNAALTTESTVYRSSGPQGIDAIGSIFFLVGTKVTRADVPAGSLVVDWQNPARAVGGAFTERDCRIAGVGLQYLFVVGRRASNVTHYLLAASDGSTVWQKDHGDNTHCCWADTASVYVGGDRVEE